MMISSIENKIKSAVKTLLISMLFSVAALATAQTDGLAVDGDRFIVVWNSVSERNKARAAQAATYTEQRELSSLPTIEVVTRDQSKSLYESMQAVRSIAGVKAVIPDYYVTINDTLPNDPDFGSLWGLDSNQAFDINAPQAWDLTTGSSDAYIVVIDSGVDYSHPDLVDNMWINADEIPGNGIDDDNNGWIDDIHGINTVSGHGDPMDDNNHGTHVAGTIAARGNNGVGVTGVAWNAGIIACKFLDEDGGGFTSDAIFCLDYVLELKTRKGLNIVATNNSWGGGGFQESMLEAIRSHRDNGILFVTAAGNEANDNDKKPSYPVNYGLDNIISVAAMNEVGELASFSNYGQYSTTIAAPGVAIYSTLPGKRYGRLSGTSMASPHVAGALALLAAQYPLLDWKELKNLLIAGAAKDINFLDKVAFGRLQLWGESDSGAINCSNQQVSQSLSANEERVSKPIGDNLLLTYKSIVCESPTAAPVIDVSGLIQITMVDDGTQGDTVAGDGVFAATVPLDWLGELNISVIGDDASAFSVTVFEKPEFYVRESNYIEIDGQVLDLVDDDVMLIPVDFAIKTPLGDFEDIYIAENGGIMGENISLDWENSSLPVASNRKLILPFWDDLYPNSATEHSFEVIGEAPNRKVVIEFKNVTLWQNGILGDDYDITFQAVLFENRQRVEYNYKDVTAERLANLTNGVSATVGIEVNGVHSEFSVDTAALTDGLSIALVPPSSVVIPKIESFDYTGITRTGYDIAILGSVSNTNSEELPVMTIDLADGLGYRAFSGQLVTSFAAGSYEFILRATNEYDSVTEKLLVEIQELSELELNLIEHAIANQTLPIIADPIQCDIDDVQNQILIAEEQLLADIEASPELFGYKTLDAVAAEIQLVLESTERLTLERVAQNPESYGYATLDAVAAEIQLVLESTESLTLERVAQNPESYGYATLDAVAAEIQLVLESTESLTLERVAQNPESYGYATLDIVAEKEMAAATVQLEAIIANPESFGFTAQIDTAEAVAALGAGVHLVSVNDDIDNINEHFASVKFVWVYQQGEFYGWSDDAALRARIVNSGYKLIESVEKGSGIWISK